MSLFLFGLLVLLMIAYLELLKKYNKVTNELFEAGVKFNNLKLLNKLKVDWEGNPIYYDG